MQTYEYKAAAEKQAAGSADLGQKAINKGPADRKAATAAENVMGAKKEIADKKASRCQTKGKQAPGEKQAVEQTAAEETAVDKTAPTQAAAPNTPESAKKILV